MDCLLSQENRSVSADRCGGERGSRVWTIGTKRRVVLTPVRHPPSQTGQGHGSPKCHSPAPSDVRYRQGSGARGLPGRHRLRLLSGRQPALRHYARAAHPFAAGNGPLPILGFRRGELPAALAEEAKERIAVNGALGAIYTPHCAGIHPAKLARGLARSVEALGVSIYEKTTALEILANELRTSHGSIKAEVIVRATETYTTQLPGLRRSVVPVYSLMVATEPLSDETWEEIGWQERECWADARHLLVYILRTADNRIAMGGRGAPYHFGSRIDPSYEQEPKVFNLVKETMSELLPPTAKAKITHRWGGPVGLPRDWYSSVGLDRSSGIAWAGGYVGDGVSTTNLAGRTLADLITETDSDLTSLPW